jgi:hypothetical protein
MDKEYVFPQSISVGDMAKSMGGLTLRDYFAGQAISALLGRTLSIGNTPSTTAEVIAYSAYNIADALIAERNKE